jgi:hypothetical protein
VKSRDRDPVGDRRLFVRRVWEDDRLSPIERLDPAPGAENK